MLHRIVTLIAAILICDSLHADDLSRPQQLVVACHRVDVDSVVRLLRSGVDVNATFGKGDTRKHFQDPWSGGWPAHAGQWTPLLALANSSRYPTCPRPYENSIEHLDWARKTQKAIPESDIHKRDQNRVAILRILLSHNCNVDVQDYRGATALYDSLYRRHTDMVKLLLQFKPNVNTKTGIYIDGIPDITPLHRASWSPELTRLLIESGADDTAKDGRGRTPADWRKPAPDPFGGEGPFGN